MDNDSHPVNAGRPQVDRHRVTPAIVPVCSVIGQTLLGNTIVVQAVHRASAFR